MYSVVENKNSDFYGIWQQHKQLKTMEMSEDSPDVYNDEYIHQFQPKPALKILSQQQKHQV